MRVLATGSQNNPSAAVPAATVAQLQEATLLLAQRAVGMATITVVLAVLTAVMAVASALLATPGAL